MVRIATLMGVSPGSFEHLGCRVLSLTVMKGRAGTDSAERQGAKGDQCDCVEREMGAGSGRRARPRAKQRDCDDELWRL